MGIDSKLDVVVLCAAPITDQNFRRMKLELLTQHFSVTVLDISQALGRVSMSNSSLNWPRVEKFSTFESLVSSLVELKPAYCFDYVGVGEGSDEVSRALRSAGVKQIAQRLGFQPYPPLNKRLIRFARSLCAILIPKKSSELRVRESNDQILAPRRGGSVLELLAPTVNRWKGLVHPPFASLHGGKKTVDAFTRRSSHKFWVGADDYQAWQENENQPVSVSPTSGERYAVFVDDALVLADDWSVLGLEPPVDERTYRSLIMSTFEIFENQAGMPIVIAGHPSMASRADYARLFGGREIIFNATNSLVKNAQVVLTHASTAVSFAVLNKKPIVLLTSSEIQRSHYGLSVEALSKALKIRIHRMSVGGGAPISIKPVNRNVYERYVFNYLLGVSPGEQIGWPELLKSITRIADNFAASR